MPYASIRMTMRDPARFDSGGVQAASRKMRSEVVHAHRVDA